MTTFVTNDEIQTPVANPYVNELFNTLNTHIDMSASGYEDAASFEDYLSGMNTQQRDNAVGKIWDQLVSFEDTWGYTSYENLRNNIDLSFFDEAPITSGPIPTRYDQFENVEPDEGYIVNIDDGYSYIKKDKIDLGSNWNNYYDVQGITTTGGQFIPIIGWSDQIGVDLLTDINAWLHNEGYLDTDYPNLGKQASREDKKRVGMLIDENTIERVGGLDFLREVRNPNSVFFKDFNMGTDGAQLLSSQAETIYHEFNKGFGPFRHAVNKTLYDLSNDETMIPLVQDYKRIYDDLIADGHDKDYAQSSAIKVVLEPVIMNKLAGEEVVIPFWFNDKVKDSWMNHVLGITVPELNREALMFHNDGFKKIIGTFQNYVNDGYYTPIRSGNPWENNMLPEDYMDAATYTNKMSSFINGHLNKLSGGRAPESEDDYLVQKNAIKSILMQDMMYQTRLYGDAGWNPPPAAFWLISNSNAPRFFTTLSNPHLRRFLPHGWKYRTTFYDISDFKLELFSEKTRRLLKIPYSFEEPLAASISEYLGVDRKTLNKRLINNLYDLQHENIIFTRFQNRRNVPNINRIWNGVTTTGKFTGGVKIPISKIFWMYQLAKDGVPLGMDIIEGTINGYGLFNDKWSPNSKIGKDFFDATGVWEADPGERNWFSVEDGWEMAWFLEDNIVGISGMVGYDTFMRNQADYSKIHNDAYKIFDGIATSITDSYNRGVASKSTLEFLGSQFHKKITESPEYLALDSDEARLEHYKKAFFYLAFDKTSTFAKDGAEIKGAFYQDVLREYVYAFNGYEGGLSMLNRLRVGNDTNKMYVRDIPPPANFPQELWDEMIDIATMSDEDYVKKYPDGVGIKAWWDRGGTMYQTSHTDSLINKPPTSDTYPEVTYHTSRDKRVDLQEYSSISKIDTYSIENQLYNNYYKRDKIEGEDDLKSFYKDDVTYGPHPYFSIEGTQATGGKSNTYFDYNIFSSINTTFDTVYNSKVLRDTDAIIDDWIENVTQTKKSIKKIRAAKKENELISYDEFLKNEEERALMSQIMMMPVSTRVDVQNFAENSVYLGSKPFEKVNSLLDRITSLKDEDPELYMQMMADYISIMEKMRLDKGPSIEELKKGIFDFESPF